MEMYPELLDFDDKALDIKRIIQVLLINVASAVKCLIKSVTTIQDRLLL